MLNNFLTTKVRPIRKLHVIDENDYDSFFSVFERLMGEIDGVNNLIITSNESTYTERLLEFVNRFDPDLILNSSGINDDKLALTFNTKVFNTSDSNLNINKFGSPLMTFTGKPYLVSKYPELIPNKVYANSSINFTTRSLFLALNYGIINKKEYVKLRRSYSIFKNTLVECADDISDHSTYIYDNDVKFHNICNEVGGSYGHGSSIWQINYNRNNFFIDKKHLFVSSYKNLKAILFFWNIRANYSNSKLAWIPLEELGSYENIISEDTVVVVHDELTKTLLFEKFPKNKVTIINDYYFHGPKERWTHFEHEQYLISKSDISFITHPNDKTFSDIGFGGGYMMEIRGPNEFLYPKNHILGELFQDGSHEFGFPEYFTRLSNLGISKYFSHFNPLETNGITEGFKLPSFKEIITHHISSLGFKIKETPKTFILEQLLNLTKGIEKSDLICEEKIFNLIISLTPLNRTEKIINRISSHSPINSKRDEISERIGLLKDSGEIYIPSTITNIDGIIERLGTKKEVLQKFATKIQQLYDNNILLRGKSFRCEHCTAHIWIALENLVKSNRCDECGNVVRIPIFSDSQPTSDAYKLNQLVSRAVDQGQTSTLLLLNYLSRQGFRVFDFVTNIEIYNQQSLITDIDVFVKMGNKIGICECKSSSPFTDIQLEPLIEIALKLKCNFIILSCLLEAKDLKDTVNFLENKKINMPIFILTKKELFSDEPERINKYFEVNMRSGTFPSGPIILGV